MRPLRLLSIAVLAVVLGPSAVAHALDADQLRRDIAAGLSGTTGVLASMPMTYVDVQVRPVGEGYRVEIDGLASTPGEAGVWADIGDVAFTVLDAGPGLYEVREVALPEAIELKDAQDNPVGLLAYRLQRLEGVWSSALAGFLEADFLATDGRFALTDGSLRVSLGRVGGVSRAEQDERGRFAQDATYRVLDFRSEVAGQGALEINELEGESTIRGLDLDAYGALRREVEALESQEGQPTPADISALVERITGLPVLPAGFGQRVAIGGLSAADAEGRQRFRIDHAEVDIAGSGLERDLSELRFGLKHAGLDLGPVDGVGAPAWKQLTPRASGLVLTVERLPTQRLWRGLLRAIAFAAAQSPEGEAAPGAMEQMVPMMLMAEVMPALSEAGTKVRLPHLTLEADAASLSGEGAFDVNPAAPQGATGELDIAVVGLDNLMAALEGAIEAGDQAAIGALGMASWLRSIARRETDASGAAVDRFTLRMTADGRTLLNGKPLGASSLPAE